ncbi:hypothetical protein BU17DRAFT_71170 [Hysterangium stoloniferum]|nr:hypothetical protein BU17DRAFT_71170 [Hysterangium stoloniferum]
MKSFLSVLALLSILALVSAAPLEPATVPARGLAEIAARKEKEGGILGKEGLGGLGVGEGRLGGTVGKGGLNGLVGEVVGDGEPTGKGGKKGKGKGGKGKGKGKGSRELAQPAIATPENAGELMDDDPPVHRRLYTSALFNDLEFPGPSTFALAPPIGPE